MDSDEKLRLEIKQLSNLIASNNGGNTAITQMHPTYGARTVNHFSIRQYPLNYRQPLSSRPTTLNRNIRLARYPNPFDQYCNESYLSQVFPSHSTSDDRIASNSNPSPYKLNNNRNVNGSVSAPTTELSTLAVKSTDIKVKEEIVENRRKQIYINPSYLAKMTAGQSTELNGVRPHINLAHSSFQSLAASSSSSNSSNCQISENFVVPTTSSCSSINGSTNYQQHSPSPAQSSNIILSSTNNCDSSLRAQQDGEKEAFKSLQHATSTLTTQFKLDRRVKRSPLRKVTKMKIISYKLPVISNSKRKLFKRYSMRVVPASSSKFSLFNSYWHQRSFAIAQQSFNKKLLKSFGKPRKAVIIRKGIRNVFLCSQKGQKRPSMNCFQQQGKVFQNTIYIYDLGRKSVVQIDGSNFIRKNGGKTLKRVANAKLNVVSINGNRFIRKNGGKSLKRLSESMSGTKPLLLIHSQQQQTPGVRLANRAILKSKITLSQRIWKKKQLCMFYHRFGECKRKEDGNCPYIHDRKHLMICPKFVVEKCTVKDCKLSHDLKVGRMPPCQFFNKSECSRENCPYPHVKSSAVVKKSSKSAKRSKDEETQKNPPIEKKSSTTTPRKRKLSTRKDNCSQSPDKKKKTKKPKQKDPKSRYYELSPVSQPIVSIIPRRLPKETPSTEKKQPCVPENGSTEAVRSSTDIGVENNLCAITDDAITNAVITANESRRMRLMSKISRLHERVKKKESTAPQFLAFN